MKPSLQSVYERAFVEGRLDPLDFVIAEKLGMTVEEMKTRMTNIEYLQWRAFFVWRHEKEKLEIEAAKNG